MCSLFYTKFVVFRQDARPPCPSYNNEEEEDFTQTARSIAWELIPFSAL